MLYVSLSSTSYAVMYSLFGSRLIYAYSVLREFEYSALAREFRVAEATRAILISSNFDKEVIYKRMQANEREKHHSLGQKLYAYSSQSGAWSVLGWLSMCYLDMVERLCL